jgi:hypothetical protein
VVDADGNTRGQQQQPHRSAAAWVLRRVHVGDGAMKVWVVYDPFYDPPVHSVHSTRERAQKVKDSEKPQEGTGRKYLSVDEYEVDEEIPL